MATSRARWTPRTAVSVGRTSRAAFTPPINRRSASGRSTVNVNVPSLRSPSGLGSAARRARLAGGVAADPRPRRLVEEQSEETDPADAVGECVMGSQVQRRSPVRQSFDERDVPRRAVGIERDRFQQRHEVEQLPRRSGRRTESERTWRPAAGSGSSTQAGRARIADGIVGTPAQPRRVVHREREAFGQRLDARWAIEEDECTDGHAEGGVLADPPHDRLHGTQPVSHLEILSRVRAPPFESSHGAAL